MMARAVCTLAVEQTRPQDRQAAFDIAEWRLLSGGEAWRHPCVLAEAVLVASSQSYAWLVAVNQTTMTDSGILYT